MNLVWRDSHLRYNLSQTSSSYWCDAKGPLEELSLVFTRGEQIRNLGCVYADETKLRLLLGVNAETLL